MTVTEKAIEAQAFCLLEQMKSVQLATIGEGNTPAISYTPFIIQAQKIYLFISALAPHTKHLTKQPIAALLFIEDEQSCKNMFARKRLSLECHARFIERSYKDWDSMLDLFASRQGNTVALLRTLPDFSLVELSPNHGTYIQGFGQAYRFDGLDISNAQQETGR